jgi:hypothetical protein
VVSDPGAANGAGSWLARAGNRMPDWVTGLAVLLGALAWQLRFLPTLVMLAVMIVGLLARQRHPHRPRIIQAFAEVLPVLMAGLAYVFLSPAIGHAFVGGEFANALLLLLPPVGAVALTGPLPRRAARMSTHGVAILLGTLAPLLVGVIFLRAPVLPAIALELKDQTQHTTVVRGQVVTVDDRMTTLLDDEGGVQFVLNDLLQSKTVCGTADPLPDSRVDVGGWHVEQTALEWIFPRWTPADPDPRCQGRPLHAPES